MKPSAPASPFLTAFLSPRRTVRAVLDSGREEAWVQPLFVLVALVTVANRVVAQGEQDSVFMWIGAGAVAVLVNAPLNYHLAARYVAWILRQAGGQAATMNQVRAAMAWGIWPGLAIAVATFPLLLVDLSLPLAVVNLILSALVMLLGLVWPCIAIAEAGKVSPWRFAGYFYGLSALFFLTALLVARLLVRV